MRIDLGATVTTSDGHEIGKIDKLIVDPDGSDIHTIVVRKGLFFGRDLEIPIDAIVGQHEGTAQIGYSREQLDELPTFMEGSYTTPPPERSTEFASGYGYPAAAFLWPSRWSGPVSGDPYGRDAIGAVGDEVAALHLQQDLGNAVIKAGSDVRSRDGEKLGEVHHLVFDPQTGRPTALVIRKGFLFTEDIEVPASLISSADDDRVYLDVRHDELEQHRRDPAR